jgi:hypothetical protein
MVPQEVNVTEGTMQIVQTKEQDIEVLKSQIIGAVSYLVLLQDTCQRQGAQDVFPVFNDITVQTMLAKYREIIAIRGY